MEMESSRRSLDRSKEPGLLKKPRLAAPVAPAPERDTRGVLGSKGAGAGAGAGAGPERERPFLPRGGPAGAGAPDPAASRFRTNEREREVRGEDQPPAAFRGASYQQQQQQQMQELAAQYKTALAELTFNSKPIITNLTIIAGEYLHAAKAIAAIVCANILEVPSEQKLPSLYLLDSIVKNIGRDYIKYFAARLPEVFSKAYKQVDSSIHPGMRHLFGTWKGVFPPAPLLIIEKELGFPPIINGSSSGGGTRPDSQAQRPPHSIHVNPKYLEARQHLQQPSRVKGVGSDNVGRAVTTIDEMDRPDRAPVIASSRQWAEPSIKNIQQPQRELSSDPVRERIPGPGYGDHEFVSDYSRHSDPGIPRTSGRFIERDMSDKPWCSVGKVAHETALDQRTSADANHASGEYRSGQTIIQPSANRLNTKNKSGLLTSRNWKNSEEEEYTWDDVNSRLMDPGSSNSSSWSPDDSEKPTMLRRAKRILPETEHLESKWNKLDTLSQLDEASGKVDRVPSLGETEGHLPTALIQHDSWRRADRESSADSLLTGGSTLGHRTPGLWPSREMKVSPGDLDHLTSRISSQQERHLIPGSDELSTSADLPFPRTGVRFMAPPSVAAVSSNFGSLGNPVPARSGTINKQHQQSLRSPSPSADAPASSALQPLKSHNLAENDHLKPQKPMQFSGQLKHAVPSQVTPDSFPIDLKNDIQQSDTLPNSLQSLSKISQNLKTSSVSSTPLQHHLRFLQQPESDLPMQQLQRQSLPSVQSQEPLHQPLSFGSTQSNGPSGTSNSMSSVGDALDQSSTSKILAAIMKSGLLPSTPASSFENLLIQPPLPSGPPPVQVLSTAASSVPSSSALAPVLHGYTQPSPAYSPIPLLPPLPPGPPPPSSIVGTSSQVMNTASSNTNPISSLLSSLVAKGLISSPTTKPSSSTITEMPHQVANQSSIPPTSTSMSFATTLCSSIVPPTSTSNEIPCPESSSAKGTVSSKAARADLKGLIGLNFKPEVLREFRPMVISYLYDDLEHQCIKCGLRFKIQEDIRRHFDWHASKSEVLNFDRVSRSWYAHSNDWVAGCVETSCGSVSTFREMNTLNSEKCESIVPADESQCLCALCGEPFEDFYCVERDEWMYKGTVYMSLSLPAREGNMKNMDKKEVQSPIVHAKCVSRNSNYEFDDKERAGG